MATLTFFHGTMTSGKTTALLQEAHNLRAHGLSAFLLTAAMDSRSGFGVIRSRIGIQAEAETYAAGEDLFVRLRAAHALHPIARVLVDEAQWLSRDQVWQLSDVVDDLGIEVSCYGLSSDFRGELFTGSSALMAIADQLTEMTGICTSGGKATMVARIGPDGQAQLEGPQILVGGEESYQALSRKRWKEKIRQSMRHREIRIPA